MKRIFAVFAVVLLLLFGGVVYYYFDPSETLMPRCPFYSLTGFLCPGCGSQRALHSLLHLDFDGAFRFNPLMVISLPYIVIGGVLGLMNKRNRIVLWLRINVYGKYAIYVWGVVIVLYWIVRNL